MSHDFFEQFVFEVWGALPEEFKEKLDNVEVVIEEWPDADTMRRAGVSHRSQLLGFYHGVPQTKRTRRYGSVLPDKISIYRRPIMMRCRDWQEVLETIDRVLKHELAHHFGIDDDRLREIGAY
jgi:predicted Zn-dependent protease with MMP-like domain